MDDPEIECRHCHRMIRIPCTMELFNKIVNRGSKSIQQVAPGMMPEYRELFISGICPTCWDKLFKEK